ncbi:MAG TPA: KR domain-containing protein, partial [Actinomycetales bacterium]|nr:KR domain-containing protein [Actinomycetales bacterium]
FAFARELARRVGCRVVVTGRSALPEGEPWLTVSSAEYAALRQQRLRDAGPGRVGAVRRENERRDALRELAANLSDAARSGLPVDYRACDFLDATAVQNLVRSLGDRLRVVVHNAGVAAPTRLRNKTTDTSVRVVESKLVPFVNLVEATRGRSVDYFCNVGSVAGRMGGMIGQIDYAAANEVLSRLGFWAQETLGLPVATLCWTTWEQIGLIANYEAALRYGAAMSVQEGVTRWVDELLAAEPTEAMFLGRIGTALAPTQIKGFLKFGDHPDLPWLMSRQHYLGVVEAYAPARSLRSRSELFEAKHPCLSDVTLAGDPILPVSLVLEGALSVGDWVAPEGWPLLHLREVRNLRVDLPALGFEGGSAVVLKAGTGAWEGGRWVVRVSLTTVERRPLLSCDLVYQAESGSAEPAPPPPGDPAPWEPGPAIGLGWRGVVYRHGPWLRAGDEVSTRVSPVHDSDAWATPYPPRAVLPSAAVEAMVEGIVLSSAQPAAQTLYAERIEWTPTGAREHRVAGRPADGSWWVTDSEGAVILRCGGAVLR